MWCMCIYKCVPVRARLSFLITAHIPPHEPPKNKQEKKLLQRYFDEISQDTGKYCFMVEDTLKGLELGAVEVLIVWEGLETMRYVVWVCVDVWGGGGCRAVFSFHRQPLSSTNQPIHVSTRNAGTRSATRRRGRSRCCT